VRAALILSVLPLVGCSSLLGIENPSTGSGGDGGIDAPDAPIGDHLELSVPSLQLAQQQRARIHVVFVHQGGTVRDDVTATATYSSSNPALVTAGADGITSVDTQAGAAMITVSYLGVAAVRLAVTVTAALCHPVINELSTGSSAPVNPSADEYVELYNPCTQPVTVAGWTLDYRAATTTGAADAMTMVTLAGSMAAGELRLYAGVGYTGTSPAPLDTWPGSSGILALTMGAVGLRSGPKDTGPLVDSVAYGAVSPTNPFIESHATGPLGVGISAGRAPFDGKDDGDGATDFIVGAKLTPGALNVP
jgi:hypothetical protein